MVKSCCAVGCSRRSYRGCGVSFYRIPADANRRSLWLAAINRKSWQPTEHSWLCSAHFVSGKKSEDPLSPDYIPSVFAHTSSPVKRKRRSDLVAYYRRRKAKRLSQDAARQAEIVRQEAARQKQKEASRHETEAIEVEEVREDEEDAAMALLNLSQLATRDVVVQTDSLSSLQLEELYKLREEKCKLERLVERMKMNIECFKDNSAMVRFYTGLTSFDTLMVVFKYLSPSLSKESIKGR